MYESTSAECPDVNRLAVRMWSAYADVCNLYFQPDNGEKRRYIIVRKKVDNYPNSGGKLLFDEPTYRYSAYVTMHISENLVT